jgi:hypothetical protein
VAFPWIGSNFGRIGTSKTGSRNKRVCKDSRLAEVSGYPSFFTCFLEKGVGSGIMEEMSLYRISTENGIGS